VKFKSELSDIKSKTESKTKETNTSKQFSERSKRKSLGIILKLEIIILNVL